MSAKHKQWKLRRFTAAKHDYYGVPHLERPACEITDQDNNVLFSDEFGDHIDINDSDWELIAAAPQMLQVLEDIVYRWRSPAYYEESAEEYANKVVRIAEKAIAKAEGREA